MVAFVRESDRNPDFAAELPKFIAEVRRIFEPQELSAYLESVQRVGIAGHIGADEKVEFMRNAGMMEEDPAGDAENILIVERIKEMLLG